MKRIYPRGINTKKRTLDRAAPLKHEKGRGELANTLQKEKMMLLMIIWETKVHHMQKKDEGSNQGNLRDETDVQTRISEKVVFRVKKTNGGPNTT